MGFKFFFKIVVVFGIVLVIVVFLEFVLLIFYVKEIDVDILLNVEELLISYDGINNYVMIVYEVVLLKRKLEFERE